MVMPALLWVVFWSSMMATASCFDVSRPDAPNKEQPASTD
jgi:hypothetical protein